MDVERTMEFILEQQAALASAQAAEQARFDAKTNEMREEYRQRVALAEKEIEAVRYELRRGVRLAVEEARRERKRRKEEDRKLADLVAETQRSLKQFIDSFRQPRNGHDQA